MFVVRFGGLLFVGIFFLDLHKLQTAGHLIPNRKVDVRLPGKRNSKSHGARPVHQIISIIKVDSDQ